MQSSARPRDGEDRGRRLLVIYLNDHVAGARAGAELARRVAGASRGLAYEDELTEVANEIEIDRHTLRRLMVEFDIPLTRYKIYGAWVSERLSRLKHSGRLMRRSELGLLLDLELLLAGVEGKALLWQALLTMADQERRLDRDRLEELRSRAAKQSATLRDVHQAVASAVFSSSESRRVSLGA